MVDPHEEEPSKPISRSSLIKDLWICSGLVMITLLNTLESLVGLSLSAAVALGTTFIMFMILDEVE